PSRREPARQAPPGGDAHVAGPWRGAACLQQPVRNHALSDPDHPEPGAYARAGVDIDAADKAVDLMKAWVEKARRPEMLGGLGGFAGLFDASALTSYKR